MAGVIIEGPDGAGKTSLIKKLQHDRGWPVAHVVQPVIPNVRQMLNLASCDPIIFDRYHWSPIVYGEVLRFGPELTPYDVWALEGHLMNRGFVVILCLTDPSTMRENNWKADQLWDAVREYDVVVKLRKGYQNLTSRTTLPLKTFNYQKHSFEMFDEFVETHSMPSGPVNVLGHIKPDVWFVGDERADKGSKGITIPFYDIEIYGKLLSGTLLYKSLIDNGLTWDSGVALSNSAGEDLRLMYDQLGRPRQIVALGAVASKRLHSTHIEHTMVSHPQWWRRFRYSDPEGYAQKIKEAVGA